MAKEFTFRALTEKDFLNLESHSSLVYEKGLKLKKGKAKGIFHALPLSSGIPECSWHRIVLDADITGNALIQVDYLISDNEDPALVSDHERRMRSVTFQEGKDALVATDSPGQEIRGKYIHIQVMIHRKSTDNDSPVLRSLKIYFPRLSYLRYLPQFLQDDTKYSFFLERFTALFESSFYQSEENIFNVTRYLDPEAAPFQFLSWLAGWLSLDLYELLKDKNREFILKANQFYHQKGTPGGIAEIISYLTGKKCRVKEFYNNVFRSYGIEQPFKRRVEFSDKEIYYGYHRTPSITVNTDSATNRNLLGNKGKFHDELHYTVDTSPAGRYSRNAIGIYIFVPLNEPFAVDEEGILKIIRSFIPVFVRIAAFEVVYGEKLENYPVDQVTDEYSEKIHTWHDESFSVLEGSYLDAPGWVRLMTNNTTCTTNSRLFRTFYREREVWHDL